ncbi:putative 5'-nucleotidase [Medicago truncatula]|uniref:Putative 5'-nucleotidase n=1 Tax=Medicago truncatula TaxID=3880 RepID=G7IS42_MEDTR|nr:5'-nucleotidase SurE [Medicago truncatula]AES67822.1 survival protein SurE-like phosphatase/nucleotidase [Medicago truncatula]RHN76254.1 putative 5'-nucleotidase [Medicago truncatula]
MMPPGLVSNLQEALLNRKITPSQQDESNDTVSSTNDDNPNPKPIEFDESKPIILLTNSDGVESSGLTHLVEALVLQNLYNVHVCVPQSDKSVSGHSVTIRETVEACSAQVNGATAFEISGTPVDCVSLALSGALFSWSKPVLVISGINRGSSCGHHMFYSGVVAGAREALLCGVPSLSISLNWKKDESQETDFKDAVEVCLPLINAAIRDAEKETFPKNCFLNIEIPRSPLSNKGFKLTKQSMWRSTPNWLAVSNSRYPTGHFLANPQGGLGLQFAQLGRDASAAGAARRLATQKKNLEIIESTGAAGKPDTNKVKKYFRLEFLDKQQEEIDDDDLDYRALESGYVAVTPVSLSPHTASDIQMATSDWVSAVIPGGQ